MVRCLTVSSAVVVTAFVGVGLSGVSNASPSDTLDTRFCSFDFRPPEVVQESGVDFVTASADPGQCTLEVTPNALTVCLSIQGDDSAGKCGFMWGPSEARVYYQYRPGATYVLTGRGCVNRIEPPNTLCQSFGPSHFAL
jgi:hypothetical protein